MARTKDFKSLARRHVKSDKKFAEALLCESVDAMLSGDVETGKTMLRDYIKAQSALRSLVRQPTRHPRVLSACSDPAETRKRAIYSA